MKKKKLILTPKEVADSLEEISDEQWDFIKDITKTWKQNAPHK